MMVSHTLVARPHLVLAMSDRQLGHRIVTRALPDGVGNDVRAKAHCLWHLEQSTGRLTVQSSMPVNPEHLGELEGSTPLPTFSLGDWVSVEISLACQFTPPSDVPNELRKVLKAQGRCYRSRRVIVPADRRDDWFVRKLADHGLAVDERTLRLSGVKLAHLGRLGGAIPYLDATCSGAVSDGGAFNDAIAKGIGKGRCYGLSLLRSRHQD